jgi:hypothetical protein
MRSLYTGNWVFGRLYPGKDDEQAKLLQACSNADLFTCVSTDMAALNHTKAYVSDSPKFLF